MKAKLITVLLTSIALLFFSYITTAFESGKKCRETSKNHFNCSSLGVRRIPDDLPRNIMYLDLSNNKIDKIRRTDLAFYHSLTCLHLQNNEIDCIEEDTFCGLKQLKELDLSRNKIKDATIGCNKSTVVSSIERLNIQNNKYHFNGVNFSVFRNLKFLSLDVRKNFKFDAQLKSLTHLTTLMILSKEDIRIRNDSFYGLQNLSIRNLSLHFVNNIQRPIAIDYLRPFNEIQSIQIAFGGYYTTIKDTLRSLCGLEGRRVDLLNLGANYVFTGITQELNEKDLRPLSNICVKNLDLSKNFITKISTFILWNSTFSSCVEKIDMSGNLFRMNDYLFSLYMANMPKIKKINLANIPLYEEEQQYYHQYRLHGQSLDSTKQKVALTKEAQVKSTIINVTVHLSDSLEYVDSHGIHTDFGLPESYRVYIEARGLKRANLGNMDMDVCAFRNPVKCLNFSFNVFDMSGWKCAGLNPKFLSESRCFVGLSTLIARNSDLRQGLKSDKNAIFLRGLYYLKEIDLSRNDLSNLHDHFFHDQRQSLQKVILTKNNFDGIPSAIWTLQNVKVLDMQKNMIESFSLEERNHISARKNLIIDLGENHFACSCDNLLTLKWMLIHNTNFKDTKTILCRYKNDTTVQDLLLNLRHFELECVAEMVLNISISMLILMAITICGAAYGLKYKYMIKFHYLRLKGMLSGNFDQDFVNNIFLSFTNVSGKISDDETWTLQYLVPYLANDLKFRVLCDLSFDLGAGYLDEVHIHMGKCRKIIILMSRKFLNWDEGMGHMEMARMHAFDNEKISLVVIFFDDLTTKDLPKCLVMVWFKTKFLTWPTGEFVNEERRLFRHNLKIALHDD